MEKFIFLDNWVLTEYTKEDKKQYLSDYIFNNNLTILCTPFSFVEIYNPIINENDPRDRVSRFCKFISSHKTIIVEPEDVFRLEFFSYPNEINMIPCTLDLDEIKQEHRYIALINFFKRDVQYLKMGKDIADWIRNHKNLKKTWLQEKIK